MSVDRTRDHLLDAPNSEIGSTQGSVSPPPSQDLFTVILLAMADEEPVDQKRYYEDSCKPKCVKPLIDYQACVKRIDGDDSGHKHCTGQYFDYWSCVDKCAATKIFSKLK
ncbi:hypothetical protein K1719_023305 [Acacia pycnantha]|nr:hypothetical protein K1719_023305 [Acacia pycnantha]